MVLWRSTRVLRRACTRRWLSVAATPNVFNTSEKNGGDTWLSRLHTTKSQREMEKLGARLARGRQAGDVLFLCGDLGCGKTCMARGFVRSFTGQKALAVTSPTYLLVNTYDEAVPTVFHVDLYRLDAVTQQDVAALGLSEAFDNGITLVEWPERFDQESVPAERLDVRISYDEQDAEIRHIEFQPIGERWLKLFATEAKEK